MSASYSHLFDDQAAAYAEYRPLYPPALYQQVYEFCNFASKPQLALDVATGSGQAATELAKKFCKVVAIDSNVQQLKAAKPAPGIEYRRGLAEETGMEPASVDLITVAQALHWFELQKFFEEAGRVLKPGGTFAAWGYGLCLCKDNDKATELIQNFGNNLLGPYWSERRRLVDEEYRSIVLDERIFESAQRGKVYSTTVCCVDQFVGYLSSWSSYSTYRKKHVDQEDPLIAFKKEFMLALGADNGAHNFSVVWPFFLLMARTKKA